MSELHRGPVRGGAPQPSRAHGATAGEIGREVVRVGVILSAIALVLGLLAVAMGSA
jgi:hypothetical protein